MNKSIQRERAIVCGTSSSTPRNGSGLTGERAAAEILNDDQTANFP